MGFLRKLFDDHSALPSWPPRGPITAWPDGELSFEGRVPMVLFDPRDDDDPVLSGLQYPDESTRSQACTSNECDAWERYAAGEGVGRDFVSLA
jgi:hypothetical protein